MSQSDPYGRLTLVRARRLLQLCRRSLRLIRVKRVSPGVLLELERAERRLRTARDQGPPGTSNASYTALYHQCVDRALLSARAVRDQLEAAELSKKT